MRVFFAFGGANVFKVRIENEVHRLVVTRDRKYTNFVEVRGRGEGLKGGGGQRERDGWERRQRRDGAGGAREDSAHT